MIMQSFITPIIKVTDTCNFNCEFCYYAQYKKYGNMMSVEDCKTIISKVLDYNLRQNNTKMKVIFHGGEPLLQSLNFYEAIVDFEKYLSKKNDNFEFFNSIQTNGFLINDDWISFFKREKFDVGISIDGDERYNCHYGKDGVKYATQRVLENIKKLNDSKIPFGVISVITEKHTLAPKDLYDFCIDNNIHDLSLNYCYNENSNDTVTNEKLIPFVKELFDLYAYGEYDINIREYNEMIAKATGYCTDTCATCDRNNCGQYISFDSKGNVFFCDTGYDKSTSIGNIFEKSLYEVLDSLDYLDRLITCRKIYQKYCQRCDVKDICGGGCHRYDIIEGTEYKNNYFCKTNIELAKYIEKFISSQCN